ncbi:MAG: polyribonucleotide nucleotidyltransferase [Christensenellales bacterium]|jgi:polyribonucleotide nucleotidyltransferase
MEKKFKMQLGGREITIETGKYAGQADGACLIRCGDTAILVCATMAQKARDGIDFFPLSVEYEEKMYSVGKIPGGFIKREGRPSEKAILTARLIDRPIRPLFPKGFYNDVQIIATVLSIDNDMQPDVLAMIGSSIALSISKIPFAGPTGAVAVGMIDGEYVLNPDAEQRDKSKLHLVVSGTRDAVMMVEAGAEEVSESEMLGAILFGHEHIKTIVDSINDIVVEIGKEKIEPAISGPEEALLKRVEELAAEKVEWSVDTVDRDVRNERSDQVQKEITEALAEEFPDSARDIESILYDMTKAVVRDKIINRGIRPDGRAMDKVRDIWCEAGILPRAHGSGVFTRGQTQVLTIATLGTISEVQVLDGIGTEDSKRYMHQYNMPPYSVGEARMMRGPGRREIGHGALAERSLLPVIPSETEFPYAIRLVSEVISSNGSTSQGSVCASTIALMDAGVPIKKPVAGVAMGLIKDQQNGNLAILTDIQGLEDFYGDMDFKVAGTKDGITAIQMDIKIKGIDEEILTRALEQAKKGRLHILGEMLKTIDEPRAELSKYAPKIVHFMINPEKIREVIGPSGKMINKIIDETGVKIDIEDDGSVFIASPDADAIAAARKLIENIAKDVEVGEVYLGRVTRIMNFGAFVELLPGKEGMVHISKLEHHRVEKVEDVVNIGDEILVKVIEIDEKGRVNLTRKDLIPNDKPKQDGEGRGPRPPRRDFNKN